MSHFVIYWISIKYLSSQISFLILFQDSKPVKKWSGTKIANKRYQCPQITFDLSSPPFGEEDCLYIDIYVPKLKSSKKLDVLVHIPGGTFITDFSPSIINISYVMDRDWIFVKFNYRLGALGLFSLLFISNSESD